MTQIPSVTSDQCQQTSWARVIWMVAVTTLWVLGAFTLVFALIGDWSVTERIAIAFAAALAAAVLFAGALTVAAALAVGTVAVFVTAVPATVTTAAAAIAVFAVFAAIALIALNEHSREMGLGKGKLLLLYGAQALVIVGGMLAIVRFVP